MSDSQAVSKQDVLHMALLSRLTVEESEVDLFAEQMSAILSYMNVLNGVDTSNVEPLYNPLEHEVVLRHDEAVRVRTREEVLANAPERNEEYFIVPRIV